jgi:KDO2-lipid IV(A) lauroyltransferase
MFTPRELKMLEAHLKYVTSVAPEMGKYTAKDLLEKIYQHIGESAAEVSHVKYLIEKKDPNSAEVYPAYKRIEAVGEEVCREVVESKKGTVFLSGHMGNFELLAAYHTSSQLPLTILGKEQNYDFISRWVQKSRVAYGGESLLRRNEPGGKRSSATASINALRNGRVLAVMPDQDTSLASEFVPFFGLEAAYVLAPIKMAIKYEKDIYSSFIVRTGMLQHKAITEKIDYDVNSPNPERDVLTEYSKRLEKLVLQYPEQYLWIHRRWRRRPGIDYEKNPDALRSTNEYLAWISDNPHAN